MTLDDRLDRRIKWTSWGGYVLLILILGITVWTLGTVSTGRNAQLQALAEQNELLREQNGDLDTLVERQLNEDSERDARLKRAVDDVELLLVDYFSAHDENVALKLNETLHRIAALLGRPASTAPNPAPPAATSSSDAHAAPAPSAAPSPTTTTPDQKSCAKHPDGPRC